MSIKRRTEAKECIIRKMTESKSNTFNRHIERGIKWKTGRFKRRSKENYENMRTVNG